MSHHEHKENAPRSVNCAVLTISDTRTEQNDESGMLIRQRLIQNGHQILSYAILKDEADSLKNKITELLANKKLQVIITNGGTGASHRDITVDTIRPMLERELDGFGELFRFLTYQEIGTASIMSRTIGGVVAGKIILCLPGSPEAAKLAMDRIIIPEIGHLVREATR